jgi:hypothetical protein
MEFSNSYEISSPCRRNPEANIIYMVVDYATNGIPLSSKKWDVPLGENEQWYDEGFIYTFLTSFVMSGNQCIDRSPNLKLSAKVVHPNAWAYLEKLNKMGKKQLFLPSFQCEPEIGVQFKNEEQVGERFTSIPSPGLDAEAKTISEMVSCFF